MALTDYIGEEITARFAGQRVTGVVTDVDHVYDQYDFEKLLKLKIENGTILAVPPESIIES